MEGCKKMIYSQWKSWSCSTRLLGFIFPLVVVAVLVALDGSKPSTWLLGHSHYYPWAWSSVFPTPHFSNYSSTTYLDKNAETFITKNSSSVALSFNDTRALTTSIRIRRTFSNLVGIEMKLQHARAAIKNVQRGEKMHDPDYVPTGPIYWNASAFHKSYLEMEKQFKIFVYEEGEPPFFHDGPCGGMFFMEGIYSTEGNFIHNIEISKFRTRNPENAHIYFLPFSATFIFRFVRVPTADLFMTKVNQVVIDYIDLVAKRYPYWNRSRGGDHLMLACYDWGPLLSSAVPDLFNNSIRALCNANTSDGFRPSKDVSIPEIFRPGGKTYGKIGGMPPLERHILAFFAGGVHGPIRPILMEFWEKKDKDIQVHEYLPKNVSYIDIMKKSKYCLCPSGYEVASPRMVESLYTGCVPVFIKDHYVAPYSDVLNWKSFSVEVPVEEIPNLKKILMAISTKEYLRMYKGGVQARRHFEVNVVPKRYDNFHMTLHSIWLRRLNIRVDGV